MQNILSYHLGWIHLIHTTYRKRKFLRAHSYVMGTLCFLRKTGSLAGRWSASSGEAGTGRICTLLTSLSLGPPAYLCALSTFSTPIAVCFSGSYFCPVCRLLGSGARSVGAASVALPTRGPVCCLSGLPCAPISLLTPLPARHTLPLRLCVLAPDPSCAARV